MNLNLVYKILKAVDDQPYGFLKLRGIDFAREVEMMAAAGLVESAGTVTGMETFAVIKRVTASGYSFLRAFNSGPPVPTPSRDKTPLGSEI
jgi:hypothetical protein